MRPQVQRFAAALACAAALFAGPGLAAPVPDSQACAGQARGFDFWLGEWLIRQRIITADGGWMDLPARTIVTRADGACVVSEHWRGEVQFFWEGMSEPERIWGHSVRVYDPGEEAWRIYWMDSRNPRFGAPFVGRIADGQGVFTQEAGASGRMARIVFAQAGEGVVDWRLSVSSDAGANWTTVWTMHMQRADLAR